MRKFALLLVLLIPASEPRAAAILPDSLFLAGLEAAGLTAAELSCFPESYEADAFRLPLIQALMSRPADSDSLLAPLLDALFAPPVEEDPLGAPDLSFLARLGAWLHPDLAGQGKLPWESARIDLLESQGERPLAPARFFHDLMPPLLDQRRRALSALDEAEQGVLMYRSPLLLDEGGDMEAVRDPIELRRLEARQEAFIDSTLVLWTRVHRSLLYRLGLRFIRDSIWYARILKTETYDSPERRPEPLPGQGYDFPDGSRAEGSLLYAAATPHGNVAVGAEGVNRYHGDFLFILDLDGDDFYQLAASRPRDPGDLGSGAGFRCLVDCGGDDHWRGEGDFALAGAFLGAGILVDAAGDDVYQAQDFDLGCGWLGTGILVDRAGDDLYAGGAAVMGAGGGGLGLLRDESGEDVYRAKLYAQGFAWVGGCGLLEDRSGGDVYAVLPAYKDILRYEDHDLSLSQGFSIGARPDYSGGLGILRDGGGNDSYLADIYGQGASYWYALGLLQDLGGNDRYEAYQYAQGAGIHLALGYLLDDAGNDSYSSHGVGQGCGHDLAFGLLRDQDGNDRYSCDDLSQGAGSANGIGVLLDGAGLDGYLSKGETAPAYGNPRRHFGSVGLLVDGSGEDWFSARAVPGERRGSLEGTLLDRDVPLTGPAWDPGPAVAYRDSAWSMADYLLMAGSGEPRFREWQQAGMDSLIANPAAAIAALIPRFDTDIARERHRIKDVMQAIGVPAVEPLREVLRQGPPAYWRQAAWCLEVIGEAAAFPELMALLAEPRDHRDTVSALAGLAGIKNLDPLQARLLRRSCERLAARPGVHPLARKEIAYLLGRQGLQSGELLVELAADEHYAPRWMARRSLAETENWGGILRRAWRRALAEDGPARAIRLSRLLPLRPARETATLLRAARRSPLGEDPGLRRALARALCDHPDAEHRALAADRERYSL